MLNFYHNIFLQHKRLQALEEFKSGKCNIVLCTDVLSRGLDIEAVDMVINYDIPTDPKVRCDRQHFYSFVDVWFTTVITIIKS
jgi:ATP-dependent helicase YprA (DUF1998 family)